MTNIIIGIIIGMVIWQLFVSVIGAITDFDNEKANYFLFGVWFVLFCVTVLPIAFLIRKIIFYRFFSKYLKCEFMENDKIGIHYFVDKDIAKTYETSPDKKYHVKITKANYDYLPYRDNIITKEKIEMHPEWYEFLNKWKKVD